VVVPELVVISDAPVRRTKSSTFVLHNNHEKDMEYKISFAPHKKYRVEVQPPTGKVSKKGGSVTITITVKLRCTTNILTLGTIDLSRALSYYLNFLQKARVIQAQCELFWQFKAHCLVI
jgi:hypothetical protein